METETSTESLLLLVHIVAKSASLLLWTGVTTK